MNDNLRDAAFRAGLWQTIEQRAKELKDEAKAELAQLEPGDTVAGRVGDQTIAKATMSKGRDKFVIDDEELFLAWVKQYHPEEIVESVRSSFVDSLKLASKDLAVPIDRNGVVVDGVQWQQGSPYVSVRREKDAPFIVAQLLSSGRLSLDGVQPELTAEPETRWEQDAEAGAIG